MSGRIPLTEELTNGTVASSLGGAPLTGFVRTVPAILGEWSITVGD